MHTPHYPSYGQAPRTPQTQPQAGGGKPGKSEDPALALDIQHVKNGADTRTSLMVRNIPNK